MPIFLDRSRKGDDPWLEWKVRLFLGGAAAAVVAMAVESGWLMVIAIGILVCGFFLRFFPHPSAVEEEEGDEVSESGPAS